MFANREEAGEKLASEIQRYILSDHKKPAVVVGILRGGVLAAKPIANKLKLPLDVVIIKKIPSLNQQELAIGAVGEGEIVYWDEDIIANLKLSSNTKKLFLEKNYSLVKERKKRLLSVRHKISYKNRTVILVDDGVATGATIICAKKILEKRGAKEIILTTPVISRDVYNKLQKYFGKIIALDISDRFYAVGQFYKDFPQINEEKVLDILSS